MTEQETKKKGRWKPKVYSRQLMEYANQSLRDDEKNLYKTLFDEIKTSNGIEKVEHLMMLDTTIYDFIRIKRIHNIIMREGDVVRLKLRGGQVITKAHEASYLLNAVQTQFRNNMKELMLTKKEIVKKIDVHSLYFHDGLNMEEHLKYATLGVFYLERDIRYYNEWYK